MFQSSVWIWFLFKTTFLSVSKICSKGFSLLSYLEITILKSACFQGTSEADRLRRGNIAAALGSYKSDIHPDLEENCDSRAFISRLYVFWNFQIKKKMGGNEAACRQDTFFCFLCITIFLRNDQRELKGVGMVTNVGLFSGTMLIKPSWNWFKTSRFPF